MGRDYQYTKTLINTQTDKLGGDLGSFLRDTILPDIYSAMAKRDWPTCPYVNPIRATPDEGIEDFLEVPRFSTGYAALHHCIGFMPETHMLKPFADRYASMRALVEVVLAITVANAAHIQALRHAARQAASAQRRWPVLWAPDTSRPSAFKFKGYAAVYRPSVLGNYNRLAYDRNQPWERDIPWFNRCTVALQVDAPRPIWFPRAWREVIERLQWNGVVLRRLEADKACRRRSTALAHCKRGRVPTRDTCSTTAWNSPCTPKPSTHAQAMCWWICRNPARATPWKRWEPQAHDSFFRWGFFNSVLEKKEAYSDYVFEDTALEMLEEEPELRARFEAWKQASPERLADQAAVLTSFSPTATLPRAGVAALPVVGLL